MGYAKYLQTLHPIDVFGAMLDTFVDKLRPPKDSVLKKVPGFFADYLCWRKISNSKGCTLFSLVPCFAGHSMRNRTKHAFHHREMLNIVVSDKECIPDIQLCQYTSNTP